ncbi:c-type cytochrome biogenesis protein CcmI [Yoonia sp.]|uniref:c-type cytochrome biogenesis protein CcmI n=1 Tax=Yoonia sp. TaxID=2212373 RepID=UPI0023916B34|nr:c-type cytochrome biogenesis protein CcmI [Yoonia sp.]MDE0851193.1 c-type cytochrome biogenesis protein CcmI [Yoonia sp.]
MLFWIICFVLTCVVGLLVITPLIRPPEGVAADPQVALYKAQLEEVDRDVARDVLDASEAEHAKTEIARRLLAAAGTGVVAREGPFNRGAAIATAAVLLVLSGGTYWQLGAPGYPDLPLKTRIANGDEFRANRPTQATAELSAPVPIAPDHPADYIESVEKLRAIVPLRPDDAQGWELLAFHETQSRNYPAAAAAQARVNELKGDTATVEDLLKHADLLAAAADGYVSPQTEMIAREVLRLEPNNVAGRYYLGAMYDQTDRPDLAFRLWRGILESGAAETFHLALARRFVEDAAVRAGTNYTPPPATNVDLADALTDEDLDPEARDEMIAGMVAGLADRLATQGGPVNQWARLIIAYSVLGQTDDAREILVEAQDVFGASDEAIAILDEAATRAGLTQ